MCNLSICPRCGKEFENTTKRTYCSRSCANVRYHSEETKNKISISQKLYNINNPQASINISQKIRQNHQQKYYQNPKKCKICGNVIPYSRKHLVTCSRDCFLINQSNN